MLLLNQNIFTNFTKKNKHIKNLILLNFGITKKIVFLFSQYKQINNQDNFFLRFQKKKMFFYLLKNYRTLFFLKKKKKFHQVGE